MTRINTGNSLPGILNGMTYRPLTAAPLNALAETLLRPPLGAEGLSRGERELIFAMASIINGCEFCFRVHSTCAALQLQDGDDVVAAIFGSPDLRFEGQHAHPCAIQDTHPKLHELLHLAQLTTMHMYHPSYAAGMDEEIKLARAAGASDLEIHDTMLIASSAAMFNRYVNAIDAEVPKSQSFYHEVAEMLTTKGYVASIKQN